MNDDDLFHCPYCGVSFDPEFYDFPCPICDEYISLPDESEIISDEDSD